MYTRQLVEICKYNRNLGNPTIDTTTNDKIYPMDYDTANTSDEMKDLIERMINIDVDHEVNGDKILLHPIFHLEEIKRLKQQRRRRRHRRHHHHHARSKSNSLVSTQVKSKPRLNRSESSPLTTIPTKVNARKKTVKKQNQKKNTTLKKSGDKSQIRFANKARKTKTKCDIAPKLATIQE